MSIATKFERYRNCGGRGMSEISSRFQWPVVMQSDCPCRHGSSFCNVWCPFQRALPLVLALDALDVGTCTPPQQDVVDTFSGVVLANICIRRGLIWSSEIHHILHAPPEAGVSSCLFPSPRRAPSISERAPPARRQKVRAGGALFAR